MKPKRPVAIDADLRSVLGDLDSARIFEFAQAASSACDAERPALVAGATGLQPAERHLLEAHRVELARGLFDVCLFLRCHVQPYSRRLSPMVVERGRLASIGWGPTMEGAGPVGGSRAADELLRVLKGEAQPDELKLEEVASIAEGISPTAVFRIFQAQGLRETGRAQEAISLLEGLLAVAIPDREKAVAAAALACTLSMQGKLFQAMHWHRRAHLFDRCFGDDLAYWFVLACYAEDLTEARSSAERLTDELEESVLTSVCAFFKAQALEDPSWEAPSPEFVSKLGLLPDAGSRLLAACCSPS